MGPTGAIFACIVLAAGAGAAEERTMPTIEITSPAFEEGETIPKRHTCDGADLSPALRWSPPPEGTRCLALICDDPDAPVGLWVHWVVWGIPPDSTGLPEGMPAEKQLPNGVRQGTNDFRKTGYGGPCPPKGKPHRYDFRLFALDAPLSLPPGATRKDLLKAMEGRILAEGVLMGRYGR